MESINLSYTHDNDTLRDCHAIPFAMRLDCDAITRALAKVNYQGYITLEADSHLSKYSAENVYEGIAQMSRAARRIANMVESAK